MSTSSSVTIIDAERKVALATVPAGPKAHDVAVSPDGRIAVAADVGGDTIAVIDVARQEPLGVLTTGAKAMMSMFGRDGRLLYVGNAGDGHGLGCRRGELDGARDAARRGWDDEVRAR